MTETEKPLNFLQQIISSELADGTVQSVHTRFPPEPNGYLHIGHAKSVCLNFGLAEQFGGKCNLRFDDTNPEKEEDEYVRAIQEDVRWLGFNWDGEVKFASDYFEQFYEWAVYLVKEGKAYVCELNADQTREYRGSLTEPGKDSPYRSRSVEENLDLLDKMRTGQMEEGSATLRAKIDMASPNLNLRDPVLYRIKKIPHHRTGDKWNIYPAYDFAHGQEDAIEGISHSICTLEFEDHKPLYNWFIENLPVPNKPRQFEFAPLNLGYTVTSKRKLKRLIDGGHVSGWDDPRMPTLSGLRRRGYTPESIRNFCEMIGVTRSDSLVDVSMLEFAIRSDLNENAPRAMCVLRPLKVVITNFPEGELEEMRQPVHPNREELGERVLPFTRELYIDRADFNEDSSLSRKKFKRLVPGEWVRLRGAYVIQADEIIKDDSGEVVQINASLIPGTVGENPPEGIRPRGVIHWVSASHSEAATVRLYDRLFNHETPDAAEGELEDYLADDSLVVVENARVEPSLAQAQPEQGFQFEREGYFVADRYDFKPGNLVFNMTIGLKETKG